MKCHRQKDRNMRQRYGNSTKRRKKRTVAFRAMEKQYPCWTYKNQILWSFNRSNNLSGARMQWGFMWDQGGHGPRPRAFDYPEGVPHLRQIEKKWSTVLERVDSPLSNPKKIHSKTIQTCKYFKQGPRRWFRPRAPRSLKPPLLGCHWGNPQMHPLNMSVNSRCMFNKT